MLPHPHHLPSHPPQLPPLPRVASPVLKDFLLPVPPVRLNRTSPASAAAMPEAPVYENSDTLDREDDVGRAGQLPVEAEM